MSGEPISLVVTMRDEERTVEPLLRSLAGQTRPADEIVAIDDGSTDRTAAEVERLASALELPLKLTRIPPSGIPKARNLAIDSVANPIVAVTDAGIVAEPEWLERLVLPLERDADLALSAGFFRSSGETWFERSLGAIITPRLADVDTTALPYGRSMAFRKQWWDRVGGFAEWATAACEDHVLRRDLTEAGARFAFAADATVLWLPPSTLADFARKYFGYARGDGNAGLFGRRHAIRYLTYAASLLAARGGRLAKLALAGGFAAYAQRYFRRLLAQPSTDDAPARLGALALVPVVVVTGDVAKMAGYAVGRAEAGTVVASAAAEADQ